MWTHLLSRLLKSKCFSFINVLNVKLRLLVLTDLNCIVKTQTLFGKKKEQKIVCPYCQVDTDVNTEEQVVDLATNWFVMNIITQMSLVVPVAVASIEENLLISQSPSPGPSNADPIPPASTASSSYIDGNTTSVLESRYRDELISIHRPKSPDQKPPRRKKKSKKHSKRNKRGFLFCFYCCGITLIHTHS